MATEQQSVADRLRLAARPQVYRVLLHLKANPDQDARQLSKVADTSVPVTQMLLVAMSRAGLVDRHRSEPEVNPRGRRSYVYRLPPVMLDWLSLSQLAFHEGQGGERCSASS